MRSVYVSGVGTRGGQSMQLMYRSFDGDDHWVGPTAVASGVAPSVFDPQLGLITSILMSLGLSDHGIAWLADPSTAMGSAVVAAVWNFALSSRFVWGRY